MSDYFLSKKETIMTLYETIIVLEEAGHDEIWIVTSDDGDSYRKDPAFPGSWLHPKIVSRDGRVLAERIAKPNDWSLCGDWRITAVRPACAAPYQAESLRKQITSLREKAALDAILLGGDDSRVKKRI
ncbi:hypothetical protein U7210_003001 [Escherichia coli]|uniref:hypothetical protein n=1 Tax=Escherichia coli TaxID=562 RepID=UPI0023F6B4B3|nr:hypothetical protein [Escherichia coli]ELU5571225.1 hypothetical protein [Escherichia coli]EMB1337554.1 hypothetical protein [Escherichia coli]MDF7600510.1 hypothetical protein [Escherichia coli]MDF7606085.1 hypothetical protein [Escherichia coli]MDF7621381.1 hypothetical protein [Escherichia coli]